MPKRRNGISLKMTKIRNRMIFLNIELNNLYVIIAIFFPNFAKLDQLVTDLIKINI